MPLDKNKEGSQWSYMYLAFPFEEPYFGFTSDCMTGTLIIVLVIDWIIDVVTTSAHNAQWARDDNEYDIPHPANETWPQMSHIPQLHIRVHKEWVNPDF